METPSEGVGIVFPPDTRVQVTETRVFPYSAIGRLTMQFQNKSYSGTGTLIDSQHVVTAAHNLWSGKMGGYAQQVAFTPAQNGGNAPFGTILAQKYWVTEDYQTVNPPSPLVTPDGTVTDYTQYLWDFGLVRLAKPVSIDAGYCTIQDFPDDVLTSNPIRITGYPGDLAQKFGTGTMWTAQGSITVSDDDDLLFYKISTYKGESGAGLIINSMGTPVICGIHVAGSAKLNSNFAVRLNSDHIATINGWRYSQSVDMQKQSVEAIVYLARHQGLRAGVRPHTRSSKSGDEENPSSKRVVFIEFPEKTIEWLFNGTESDTAYLDSFPQYGH